MIKVYYNTREELIEVRASGLWNPAEMDRYEVDLIEAINIARQATGRIRLLADLRETVVQTQRVVDRIPDLINDHFRACDTIAIVVPSMLVKMQIRRIIRGVDVEMFSDIFDAKNWLEKN